MAKVESSKSIQKLLEKSEKYALTNINYPSRGQTSVQEIYQTSIGKLFLKKVSKQNHIDCKVDPKSGTLAEREFWAFRLANYLGLPVPQMWLLDSMTTVQAWLDYPDVRQYSTNHGRLHLELENVFDCGLFDWLTGQVDRHDANYLYDYVSQKIILIDSAHTFLKYSGSLPDYLRFFEVAYPSCLSSRCDTKILKKIRLLSSKKIASLVPLVDEFESKALLLRCDDLIKVSTIQDLIVLYRSKR